ncbi:MAG: acyltransferase family protein [Erysipelotrichaceae bacterium]|nr:acyltransferase family protein [Erysipelotrichaceae bacterium]
MKKNYYKFWDIFRALLVIAVLMYHLGVLQGGFLAVCCFFALSGYLTARSLYSKDLKYLGKYYLNRLKKLYLPLLTVVSITLIITCFLKDLVWVSMKPETTSVLFGYNNLWQISANLDYFARHTDSPFMHFWYIAILLQFELVFPPVYLILRKIFGDHKKIETVFYNALAIGSIWLFFWYNQNQPIMTVYYHTFSRISALMIGVAGFYNHGYFEKKLDDKILNGINYWIMMIIFIVMFVSVSPESKYFAELMTLSALCTDYVIELAMNMDDRKIPVIDQIISCISKISYEVYLVQYPVIFFAQYLFFSGYQSALGRCLIAIISVLAAYAVNQMVNTKFEKTGLIALALLIAINGTGTVRYVLAKDHTAEMKALEEQLAQNEQMLADKQKEYEEQAKAQREEWEKKMAELENGEEGLKEIVLNLPITTVGDSVMVGATQKLYDTFNNIYVDAAVSRTAWVVEGILTPLKKKGILGKAVVIHLGTNGDVPEAVKDKIMSICGDSDVFWVTVTNDRNVHVNDKLKKFVEKYPNAHLLDWETLSAPHPEYFYSDGIHLNPTGRAGYAREVYNAIYNLYLERYNAQKQEVLDQIEREKRERIGFYGNDLLVNTFDSLKNAYENAAFNVISEEYNAEQMIEDVSAAASDDTLAYNLIFAFDSKMEISLPQYEKLISLCGDRKLYFVQLRNDLSALSSHENVTLIDFSSQLASNGSYLLADKVHLSAEGNKALSELIQQTLNQNR